MAITITFSSTNGGSAITEPLDHSSSAAGNTTAIQDIYIEHDANNSLTNCKFWMNSYSGTYSGDASASDDLAELIAWGDGTIAASFGGFQINMDAINSFAASWPTYSSKGSSLGTSVVFRTGTGDSADNGITLSSNMSSEMTGNGVIPADLTNWPHFKTRIEVPSDETILGVRQFDQKFIFSYTS